MRSALLLPLALSLGACALFRSESSAEGSFVRAESLAQEELEPVAFRPGRPRAARVVGLVPCARGVFPARECWRKGDRHVIYPEAPPEDLDLNPALAPTKD